MFLVFCTDGQIYVQNFEFSWKMCEAGMGCRVCFHGPKLSHEIHMEGTKPFDLLFIRGV